MSTREQNRSTSYEGRALARPGEELTDQGLAFDVATLVTRRQALGALGLGAAALGLAACSSGTTSGSSASGSREIPDETDGPYPGDGSNGPDVLEQGGEAAARRTGVQHLLLLPLVGQRV